MGNAISRVIAGEAQVFGFRTENKFLFDIMLANIDLNAAADREMAELIETDGTDDTALPCRYLNELIGGYLTGDHLSAIVNVIKVEPDAEPRYYYLNNKLFINCGQIVFMLSGGRPIASIASQAL